MWISTVGFYLCYSWGRFAGIQQVPQQRLLNPVAGSSVLLNLTEPEAPKTYKGARVLGWQ